MVKLIWKNKTDKASEMENLINSSSNYFEQFESHSSFSDDKIKKKTSTKSWRNQLFWGENLELLYYLLNKFEDTIDLIYIDPPFFSGVNYEINIKEDGRSYDSIAYYDHWNKDLDSYLQMIYERIIIFKKLLVKTGLLFIHSDWHANHYIKLILDEVFGEKQFINSIVWYYYNKYSAGKKNLPRAHDYILVYSKSNNYTFNELRIPRKKPRKQLMREMKNGVLKNVKDERGHVKYRVVTDKKLDDVWKIPCLQPASSHWTGYPTQKHHDLLKRIIKIGSNEGDLIADFFCGSGTTLLVAEELNRRWIGCDISQYSIYLTRKRLLKFREHNIVRENAKYPFDISTNLTVERRTLIESGFFEKELEIKRKK
ncbi:hypothetical protein LCGC14_1516250 [marine sediment metagenome]|uniref:DNA methylase N-4/N-6 domain-containing protein n=1 Tax=marine sediment metagenome TaxID=412755 RepID=A0A0F9LFL1_9ZZZZ